MLLFQFLVVIDYTVVNYRDISGRTSMRMSVVIGYSAMCGPSSMSDPDVAIDFGL